jgi:hypothetical protein
MSGFSSFLRSFEFFALLRWSLAGEDVDLLTLDDTLCYEEVMNCVGWLCADRDPVVDAVALEDDFTSLWVVRPEDFLEFAGFSGVFVVGQNDAEMRLVLTAYSLHADH